MPELQHSEFEVEQWFGDRLANLPAIVTAVSGRVHPIYLPETVTLPAITFRRVSTERARHTGGAAGQASVRFRVVCYGEANREGYKRVCRLARDLRLGLDSFRGSPATGHHIQACTLEDEGDEEEPTMYADGSLGVLHQRVLMVLVKHVEETKSLIQGTTP